MSWEVRGNRKEDAGEFPPQQSRETMCDDGERQQVKGRHATGLHACLTEDYEQFVESDTHPG